MIEYISINSFGGRRLLRSLWYEIPTHIACAYSFSFSLLFVSSFAFQLVRNSCFWSIPSLLFRLGIPFIFYYMFKKIFFQLYIEWKKGGVLGSCQATAWANRVWAIRILLRSINACLRSSALWFFLLRSLPCGDELCSKRYRIMLLCNHYALNVLYWNFKKESLRINCYNEVLIVLILGWTSMSWYLCRRFPAYYRIKI